MRVGVTECFQKGFDSRVTLEEDGWVAETRQWEIGRGRLIVRVCVFACARARISVCARVQERHLLTDRRFSLSDSGEER